MKYLFYVPVKIFFLYAVFISAGILLSYSLRKRRALAAAIMLIQAAAALYGLLLILPGFTFFGAAPNRVRTEKKLVALTFDDGPSGIYTPRILDALKGRGARATFFVMGKNVRRHPSVMKRLAAEGHEIGDHTYNHPFIMFKSDNFRRGEIEKTSDAVFRMTGARVKYYRSPYEYRDFRLLRLLRGMGLSYISHNVSAHDAFGEPSSKIADIIINSARPGDIILLHDAGGDRSATAAAIGPALDGLARKGYRAVTVSELLTAKE